MVAAVRLTYSNVGTVWARMGYGGRQKWANKAVVAKYGCGR